VIDVGGQTWIWIRVVKGFLDEDFLDGVGSGFDPARPGEVLGEGLSDEVPERHPTGPGSLGRTAMEIARQEQLRPMHV